MVTTLAALALVGAFYAASNHPVQYEGDALEARVVDGDSGDGIPNAVVVQVVHTEKFHGYARVVLLRETKTDDHGRFSFGPWGPELRRPSEFLGEHDPRLIIYKHGYAATDVTNDPKYLKTIPVESRRSSYWHGRDIELYRADESSRRDEILNIASTVRMIDPQGDVLEFFWSELAAAWTSLPPELKAGVSVPTPLARKLQNPR